MKSRRDDRSTLLGEEIPYFREKINFELLITVLAFCPVNSVNCVKARFYSRPKARFYLRPKVSDLRDHHSGTDMVMFYPRAKITLNVKIEND